MRHLDGESLAGSFVLEIPLSGRILATAHARRTYGGGLDTDETLRDMEGRRSP